MNKLYPAALDCGISPEDFWNASLKEVRDRMESAVRINRRRFKEKVQIAYYASGVILNGITSMLSKKKIDSNMPWDSFPELFEKEREEYEAQKEEDELETAVMNRKIAARKSQERYGKPSE